MSRGRQALFALLCLAGTSACPTFEVGPDVQELFVDDAATCEAAGLEPPPCRRFDVDNGTLIAAEQMQTVTLTFGYEAPDRELDHVDVQYERPGLPPEDLLCRFSTDPRAGASVVCNRVTLEGSDSLPGTTSKSTLEVELDILASEPGEHALSVSVTDIDDLDSPTLRWQFQVGEAPPPDANTG